MDKLRVWWIPQVGATEGAFYIPVETIEEGKKVMDMSVLFMLEVVYLASRD